MYNMRGACGRAYMRLPCMGYISLTATPAAVMALLLCGYLRWFHGRFRLLSYQQTRKRNAVCLHGNVVSVPDGTCCDGATVAGCNMAPLAACGNI
jgi:uncharacterized membrane protein YraQ (UPF0718 family)